MSRAYKEVIFKGQRNCQEVPDICCANSGMTAFIVGNEVVPGSAKKAGPQLFCSGKIQNKLIMYAQVEFTRMAK